MIARRLTAALLLAIVAGVPAAAPAATRYQPGLRFRVLSTPHFRIYHHPGQERLASRLAGIAESVRSSLSARLRLDAPRIVHVVLADQDDDANGTATPLPYDTITLALAWPVTSGMTGHTNDWLRLVFTHEYAHILQQDQSAGWAKACRLVLGRSPLAFPNLFLPRWQVEGLATYLESRETGQGRIHSGDSAAIVRERVRAVGAEPLDRANGGLVSWPGGLEPYLEGAFFHEYLAGRFGDAKVGELSKATSVRFYYLSSPAFRRVFGQSLGSLWADFQRQLPRQLTQEPEWPPAARQVTRHGYSVMGPRFTADARTIVYSAQDADRFPAIMATPDGGRGEPRTVTSRYGGSHLSVRGGLVVFDQLDLQDDVALRSDLYVASLAGGRAIRLTRNARVSEPDLSPDGGTIACVRVVGGRRALAFFRVTGAWPDGMSVVPTTVPVPDDPGASYGAPAWSPDGRWIAVERRRLGGASEIVAFETATGRERLLASSAAARNMTPAWMPDGGAVLFASDRVARTFQIFASSFEAEPATFQVTSVAGGATDPDVSADGGRMAFVTATGGGTEVFEAAVDRQTWCPAGREELGVGAVVESPAADGAAPATTGYSPLPTLLPRAWLPALETSGGRTRLGLSTDGADVLGRHAYSAAVLWRIDAPRPAVAGQHQARPDWAALYAYSRWRPELFVTGSDKTSFIARSASGGAARPDAELREQDFSAGVAWRNRLVRRTQLWQAAFVVDRNTTIASGPAGVARRNSVRSAWAINTARSYGRSISPEDGFSLALTSEQVRAGFGADGDADAFTAEWRGYMRLGGEHAVLAVRSGFGTASGDVTVRRVFYLGGEAAAGAIVNFGSGALGLLRGFDHAVTAGRRIAGLSVEWRRPIWRLERGYGTVPVFIRALHGAVFADAGEAWDREFALSAARTAVGAEAAIDIVAGFNLPLTLAAGVAWTRDGALDGQRGASAFVRLGRAF